MHLPYKHITELILLLEIVKQNYYPFAPFHVDNAHLLVELFALHVSILLILYIQYYMIQHVLKLAQMVPLKIYHYYADLAQLLVLLALTKILVNHAHKLIYTMETVFHLAHYNFIHRIIQMYAQLVLLIVDHAILQLVFYAKIEYYFKETVYAVRQTL